MKQAVSSSPDKYCCLVFDISCGVKILGYFQILNECLCIWGMFTIFIVSFVQPLSVVALVLWFIIYTICVLPYIVGGWYYYLFLRYPSAMTKELLPRAHFFNMVSISLQFGIFTIFGLVVNRGTPMGIGGLNNVPAGSIWLSNILVFVFYMLLNFYWMGVTNRYKDM